MKRLFFLVACIFALSTIASAQFTTPRYGTAPNQDATYGRQKLVYALATDVSGATDTLKFYPNAITTHIYVSVVDTLSVYCAKTSAHRGDVLVFMVSNSAGASHLLKFTGSMANATPFEVGSGTATVALTSAKRATVSFIFDGSAWVETGRVVQ